uniref:Coiled-coil domain containing 137 n=1 Tax=Podarcis muralis TaxID=64176 RepID=A0A670HS67_PODMU|nr:coiled-coil domain-containing protein 137 [Podarcis muralis]
MGKRKVRTQAAPAATASREGAAPRGRQMMMKKKTQCLDEQEIPFRLREIMRSRDELKNPKSKKKKKKEKQPGHILEGDIPVPKFKRRKGEGDSTYIGRIERETQHVMFLTKYQLQREPEKEEPVPEKSQRKKDFQKKKLDKIRRKKEEKKAALLEKDFLKDSVKFGEVAEQPPTITAKPRKSVVKDKAGKKELLLTSLLGSGGTPSTPKVFHASLARQRIVQEERERVVQAYRDIKKRKQQQMAESQLAIDKLKKPV